jgi:predicted DNA-binding transcriptional regulator YafY
MRRADRLFQIVLLMRKRRAVTARELAETLEVSERTVYRDVQDLMASGVPIDGEAGVGYRLHKGFELPPLMFTVEELAALRVGAQLAKSWSDRALAVAADSAMARIDAVLPEHVARQQRELPIFAPDYFIPEELRRRVGDLRRAVTDQRRVWMLYRNATDEASERIVRPVALFFWGGKWTAGAWCELRSAFRDFRLDRIVELRVLEDRYPIEAGKMLRDYLDYVKAQCAEADAAASG